MSFAAYVAHELRTPLATQRALLELALSDPGADVASWRETGVDVLGACKQQERLLDACLTLARSARGLQGCDLVDLAAIAREVLLAHDLGGVKRVIVLKPAWTTGDTRLIESLVGNLVSNAIRHNLPSGRLNVFTFTTAGRATFRIANTGPVIPDGELPRLFQPFQRLNSDGVGLGLAIVKAIADAHHATLTARARTSGGLGIDVDFSAPD
jgi:signal transduction histidine kinase